MRNYKITIAYDGSRYRGWQVQTSTDMTIQGKLQNILKKMTGKEIEVIGSGRTDAGVHARMQVANFHVPDEYEMEAVFCELNRYLPEDIAVLTIEEMEERFHSRFQAKEKTYLYRVHTSGISNVFERKYVYSYTEPLDIDAMRKAALEVTGTYDFTSFCGNKKMKKSAVRTISEIRIEEKQSEIDIFYTGNGFLQNMIRILTGTLLEVGQHKKQPSDMKRILEMKNREFAGYTAPPQGLILWEVKY